MLQPAPQLPTRSGAQRRSRTRRSGPSPRTDSIEKVSFSADGKQVVAIDKKGERHEASVIDSNDLLGRMRSAGVQFEVLDGSPGALSWLGGVDGRRVSPLGVDRFGQTGDLVDLYREYRLDSDAAIAAMARLFGG